MQQVKASAGPTLLKGGKFINTNQIALYFPLFNLGHPRGNHMVQSSKLIGINK